LTSTSFSRDFKAASIPNLAAVKAKLHMNPGRADDSAKRLSRRALNNTYLTVLAASQDTILKMSKR